MGQSSSAPADRPSTTPPETGPFQPGSRTQNASQSRAEWTRNNRMSLASQRSSSAFLTRTQISSRNSLERGQNDQMDNNEHDQVIFESEARPLRNMVDLRMPEAPINHISATPLPRPRSVMSRVASSIHHRYSTISMDARSSNGPWNDNGGEEVEQSAPPRRSSSVRQRLSSLSNLRRNSQLNRTRGADGRFSISRPILQSNDSTLNPAFGAAEALRRAPTPGLPLDQIVEDEGAAPPRPIRQSRMARFRQSISGPMDLFRNSFHGGQTQSRSSQRASGLTIADESDYLIPPITAQDHSLDMEEHTGRISEGIETENEQPNRDEHQRNSPQLRGPDIAPFSQQLFTPIETSRRPRRAAGSGRNLPNLLRGRSSRLIRRDDDTPLSRILQLAATAIAAQLSGNTDALASLESVGDDQLDGNLNSFVEELNNAPGAPGSARDANTPPLNFWRVFRFDNPADGRYSTTTVHNDDPRTVTLVVVGVRSVPSSTVVRGNGQMDANIDNLLDLPRLRASSLTRSNTRNSSRLNRHRTFTNNSANLAELRQNQNIADIVDFGPQPWSTLNSESPPGPYPPPSTPAERLSLSPSMPHSNFMNAAGSELPRLSLSSWIRRRSAIPSISTSPNQEIDGTSSSEDLADSINPTPITNARHFSDSEAVRRPHLRRDDTRRHGFVGPSRDREMDHRRHGFVGPPLDNEGVPRRDGFIGSSRERGVDPRRHGFVGPSRDREVSSPQGRSWLIYVIGTNLSEDSPILDLPNLFDLNVRLVSCSLITANTVKGNSYEDMLRLQELIGPVRPPTATPAEVLAAGGLFVIKIRKVDGVLLAEAVSNSDSIELQPDATCIICQEKYAVQQEIRKLGKCTHVFHKACVDTWLTQGKNSCPLCRNQGVETQQSSSNQESNSNTNNLRESEIGRAI